MILVLLSLQLVLWSWTLNQDICSSSSFVLVRDALAYVLNGDRRHYYLDIGGDIWAYCSMCRLSIS